MKSEHRHELKTNELGKLAGQIVPFFEKYGNRLLTGLVVMSVVAAAVIYWQRSSRGAAEAGWTMLSAATSPDKYAEVADKFPGTAVGAWARLSEAESRLESGVQLSFTDRTASVSDLNAAKKSFEKLLEQPKLPPTVRERGLFGLARCLESLSDGDTETAVKAYGRLLKEFPETIYREIADRQIAILKTGRGQEFYAWFYKQNPKPPDRGRPRDGGPAGGTGFLPSGHPPLTSGGGATTPATGSPTIGGEPPPPPTSERTTSKSTASPFPAASDDKKTAPKKREKTAPPFAAPSGKTSPSGKTKGGKPATKSGGSGKASP